jgi:hypothetical protein
MTYKFDSRFIGYPPIEDKVAAPASLGLLTLTPGFLYITAEDKVWGPGEFIFARANGNIRPRGLCVLTPVWDATNLTYTWNATEVPNTANLGRMLGVLVSGLSAGLVAGEYGYFCISGLTPVDCTASVAADTTFGIAAAGQGGANSAGKQILNARVVTAATQTVVKAATGDSGSNIINVSNTDGWFVGGFLSGTGVGVASRIDYIDPMGKFVRVTVVNSAAISGNVTQTNNNATIFYNIAHLNRSFAQGAIT